MILTAHVIHAVGLTGRSTRWREGQPGTSPLADESKTVVDRSEGWVTSGETSSTGWMPTTGFGSECVSRCTSDYTTWRLDTCRHSANPCPAFLVVTYARLVVVNWTFHVSIWLRTGVGRSPMPVPPLGTLYLTVSGTLILLCKPSNAVLRLSFFL